MDFFIIPIMSSLLAWLIAWLFVKLIFWPNQLGMIKLINKIDIQVFFQKEKKDAQFESILPFIDQQLNEFFTHKLGAKLPMVSMFIGEKTVDQLKAVFIDELREIFPTLIKHLAEKTKEEFTSNLESKWKPILANSLLKATRGIRIIAFAIGLIWGVLILMLIQHV